jgi:hypothetical protein
MLSARRIGRKRVLRITSAARRTSLRGSQDCTLLCCRCGGPRHQRLACRLGVEICLSFFGRSFAGRNRSMLLTIRYLCAPEPDAEGLSFLD